MEKIRKNDKEISFMNKVARDILKIKYDDKKSYETCRKEFYGIMKKYGIKRMTKSVDGVGMIGDNFEWTMCSTLFDDTYMRYKTFGTIFNTPKELMCY